MLALCLFLGLCFGLLAAACAFLISFEEYQHHFRDGRTPLRMALGTAVTTLFVFLLLSFVMGICFSLLLIRP